MSMGPVGLGLAALGFLELDPPEMIDVAAQAGFSSVSVRARAAVPGGVEHPLTPGDPMTRETIARIRHGGVSVLQVELVLLGRHTDPVSWRGLLEGAVAVGATRIVAVSDDPDLPLVADRLAQLCDVAAEHGVDVDLEFMPFRDVATLADALHVVELAGAENANVMVDALHLFRSGGTAADVAAAPAARIRVCQLCDAPGRPPPISRLADEARERRLPPGEGELPLHGLLDALPDGVDLLAEVPLALRDPQLAPLERALLVRRATAALLSQRPRPSGGAR